MKHFLVPLRSNAISVKPFISADQIKLLFSHIETILGVNAVMLKDLEKRLQTWNPMQKFGDIILGMSGYLRMYTLYVTNYDR